MTKQHKITLSASRDIPFNKLMLSQSNVRHVKAGVSIEELAEDIVRRTLLSSITVRPVLDESGAETGMYTIPAGGRRFRALELLVKQKRMNKTALVPCIVRMDERMDRRKDRAVCTTPSTNCRAIPPRSLFMPKTRRSSATCPSGSRTHAGRR